MNVQKLTLTCKAHNFFNEQPHGDTSVFFLKHVLHNWSDSSCVEILKRLRDASGESTRLVIMDSAMPYVCRSQSQENPPTTSTCIPGIEPEEAPDPLLANYGALNEMSHVLDMVVRKFRSTARSSRCASLMELLVDFRCL